MDEKIKKVITCSKLRLNKLPLAVSVFFVFLFFNFFGAGVARAATIYLSPSSGSYNVGDTFSVGMFVSSLDQAMNAVSGLVSFPTDKLEVTSISKSDSVVSLWVQEPSFSNSAGTVNLEGITLNPGFVGPAGKVVTLNFKAKSAGRAELRFTSGYILANDGDGTNILTGMGSANFDLAVKQEEPAPTPKVVTKGLPEPPTVYSPTHPNQNSWYSSNTANFEWSLTDDITGVNIFIDRSPTTKLGTESDGVISKYTFDDAGEGVWYFHIRLRNYSGWGPTGHFRFNVDTQNPENFKIIQLDREDPTNPVIGVTFEASDKTSGVSHFDVQVDDNDVERVESGDNYYETPILEPGDHVLKAKAVDRAGNFVSDSIEFNIQELPAPVFTNYPELLRTDQVLVIDGLAKEDSEINLWMQKDKGEVLNYKLKTDETGNFRYIADEKLKEGVYTIWADVTDEHGAKSGSSEEIKIIVKPSELVRVGMSIVTVLSIVVPIICLLLFMIFILWYFWYKLKKLRNKLQEEVKHAEKSVHLAFEKLKEDVREQIYLLEKAKSMRDLTENEEELMKQLKADLDEAEGSISKELDEIEKDVDKLEK